MEVLKKGGTNLFYPLFGWEGSPEKDVLEKRGYQLILTSFLVGRGPLKWTS